MLLGERGRVGREQLRELSEKYDTTGFMYTDYPHKSFWSVDFGPGGLKEALKTLFSKEPNVPLLLYVHIPYCEQLCWFCTCHMSITREYEKVKNYLEILYQEIELYRKFFEERSIRPNFREIHLGGGSPTFVHEREFGELVERLGTLADLKNLDEFALEIDPRHVDRERLQYYHSKGITRISFGVQDFDLNVQKAVNRVQPAELIENLLTPEIRERFPNGINFDLICGLPYQSPETMRRTCERVLEMSPDRICLNYLHYSPQFAPHQKIMADGRNGRPDRLPDFYERKTIFMEALAVLTQGGYVRTGYDHFAKPSDAVARAMKDGKMRWNALGVTAGRYQDVLGIGVHSLSTLGDYYSQNFYELPDYQAAVGKGEFPVYRGYRLTPGDKIRRDVIQTLRNFFSLDFRSIEEKYRISFKEYFKEELEALQEFAKDEIVELSDSAVRITELGHQFTTLICRNFDKFYTGNPRARDLGAFFDDQKVIPEHASELRTAVGLSCEISVKAKPVTLVQEQIQFYDDNGYLIVPDVFSNEACEKMKEEAESLGDGKEYHALLNIYRKNNLFLNTVKDPVLVSMVKALQRHKVVGLNDQYFFKKPGTPYAKQAWSPHQDVTYINARDGTYIQLHIFLMDSEKENGGLFYYPGSHREPKLPYEYRLSWREEFDEDGVSHPGWLIKEIPPQYRRVDVVGRKGGICFQHGNIIHGSYPNSTQERSRNQYSIAYLNEGEKFLGGRSSIKVPVAVE